MSLFDIYRDPLLFVKNVTLEQITDEPITVINNQAILQQVPDEFSGVTISGYTYLSSGIPTGTNFCVDWTNGKLTFASTVSDGTQLLANYFGRGYLYISTSRIFHYDEDTDIITNLRDIVDNANAYLSISDELVSKGDFDINTIYSKRNIVNYENSVYMYINDVSINGHLPTDTDYWEVIFSFDNVINNANSYATNSTIMIYKTPVSTYSDIATTYPNPELGWRVQVLDTNQIFRYNGTEWEHIETVSQITNIEARNSDPTEDLFSGRMWLIAD